MITHKKRDNNKWCFAAILLIGFLSGALLLSCQSKSAETNETILADSLAQAVVPRDSIISFEALFAPDQYSKFLNTYWSNGCYKKWYDVAKAASIDLPCKCSGILPTMDNDSLTISLNNMTCFTPEMEAEGYHLNHRIALPLETLRPFLNEAGKRIVFESGAYLQGWLANQKKVATTVIESPYTLYVSVVVKGIGFRIVLQSQEGPNEREGTITGYYEMRDGSKIEVTGYRTWGGFVVYDRTKDATTAIDFSWEEQAKTDYSHKVGERYISAIVGDSNVYIEALKLIGAASLYEGPEAEYRKPENGVPD